MVSDANATKGIERGGYGVVGIATGQKGDWNDHVLKKYAYLKGMIFPLFL